MTALTLSDGSRRRGSAFAFIAFVFTSALVFCVPPVSAGAGDLNDDGLSTVQDLSLLNAYLDGSRVLSEEQLDQGDIDRNGYVDQHDRSLLVDLILLRDVSSAIAAANFSVSNLRTPAAIETGGFFNATFTFENTGDRVLDDSTSIRFFLSSDDAGGDEADLFVGKYELDARVLPGGTISVTTALRAPNLEGGFYLIAEITPEGAVSPVYAASAAPANFVLPYSASVTADVSVAPVGQAIPLIGSATLRDGTPAPFVPVSIWLNQNGISRKLSTVTDAAGRFQTQWLPDKGDAGDYQIGASHPGDPSFRVQATVSLLNLRIELDQAAVAFPEGGNGVVTGTIRNLSSRSLTGLRVQTPSAMPVGLGLHTTFDGGTSLPADAEATFQLDFTAISGSDLDGTLTVSFKSAEGVEVPVNLGIRVEPLLASLEVESALPLEAGVLRNEPKTISIVITNRGNAPTGPIRASLPNLPWFNLSLASPLPSLEPGEDLRLPLSLSPSQAVELTRYSGTIFLEPQYGSGISIPFVIRVVSELKGDLEVFVEDELTYFTEAAPRVASARVTLRDAIDQSLVFEGQTASDGSLSIPGLNEGRYYLNANTPDHNGSTRLIEIIAGKTNRETLFITKDFVSYEWTVEPIEIRDSYRIRVKSTFETNVPAPVVVVSPGHLDIEDLMEIGDWKVVDFEISNVGLIAAENVGLNFPSSPYYTFEAAVESGFSLPAKSSITIPVVVVRTALPNSGTSAKGIPVRFKMASGDPPVRKQVEELPCSIITFYYEYVCGTWIASRTTVVPISGADCDDDNPPFVLPRYPSPRRDEDPSSRERGGEGGWFGGIPFGILRVNDNAGGYTSFTVSIPDEICLPIPCWMKPFIECVPFLKPFKAVTGAVGKANCGLGVLNTALGRQDAPWGDLVDCICAFGPCDDIVPFYGCIKAIISDPCAHLRAPLVPAAMRAASASNGDYELLPKELLDEIAKEDLMLAEAGDRLSRFYAPELYLFGGVDAFLAYRDSSATAWRASFGQAIDAGSDDGALITEAERDALLAQAGAEGLDVFHLSSLVDRFRVSELLRRQGITTDAEAPASDRGRFIDVQVLQALAEDSLLAALESEANGYAHPAVEFSAMAEQFANSFDSADGGVCARVVMQIDQRAVLTRTAFRASLKLENRSEALPMKMVHFDFEIRDANGNEASDRFAVELDTLAGIASIDGSSDLQGGSAAAMSWVLIPNEDAAPTAEQAYTLGGTISFLLGDEYVEIPVEPARITVQPDASLNLKYFHQRDVYSDDPRTAEVEPAEPFALAVMVENNGAGSARGLSIASSQPEIVENEKGLLIDFEIISTSVSGSNTVPSLTAEFGEIAPGESKVATWLLRSTLQGLFIGYEATFEHEDGNGDPRLSLIKNVEIFETIRMFEAPGVLDDGIPDFFVNGVPDALDLGDTMHLSDGSTAPVGLIETVSILNDNTSGSTRTVELSAALSLTGWSYLRIDDPGGPGYRLAGVARSDGQEMQIGGNAWKSDRTFLGLGQQPRREEIFHLVDFQSTGSYILTYQAVPVPDTTPPDSATIINGLRNGGSILLEWSGTDDTGVARYDVYVSENGGEFLLWIEDTTQTSAVFEGTPGTNYRFYTLATDAAGNVQSTPGGNFAGVTVQANLPPTIQPIPTLSVTEGESFSYRVRATDPDGFDTALRYSLDSPQLGLSIDPVTGWMRWDTVEGDGGQTVPITVTVRDGAATSGERSLSFDLNVFGENLRPVLDPIPIVSVETSDLLQVVATASDPDIPAQTLTFSLGDDAPAGMTINPASGLIRWPAEAGLAGRYISTTVRVTDSGSPQRSAETSLVVAVIDAEPPVLLEPAPDLAGAFNGLVHAYYHGTWSALPDLDFLRPYKRGFVGNFDLSVRERASSFAIVYSGFLYIDTEDVYTFHASADNGVRLTLGGERILQIEESEGGEERFGTVGLKPGFHRLVVEYYQGAASDAPALAIDWEATDLPREPIPDTALFYDLAELFEGDASADRDLDGIPDDLEAAYGFLPDNPDTDGDGIIDGLEDNDGDGISNAAEIAAGLNPLEADSDGNGIPDGEEDPDGDSLTFLEELAAGTDPLLSDTDGDGWNDETEITAGSNPLDPRSTPLHRQNLSPVGAAAIHIPMSAHAAGVVADSTGIAQSASLTVDSTPVVGKGEPAIVLDTRQPD